MLTKSDMLTEIRKLRKENNGSFNDLKSSLTSHGTTMDGLKHWTEQLDKRLTEADRRVSATEDGQI